MPPIPPWCKGELRLRKRAFTSLQLKGAPTTKSRRMPVRSRTGASLHILSNLASHQCFGEVPADAAFWDDGDSESDSPSPRSELVESQPTTRPRYEGVYHCEFCPYSNEILHNVTRHERRHTGEKPFHCSICKKAFAFSSDLRIHVRTHTGEKPFCCEVCQKAFVKKSHLVLHKRVHTGEKPYQCGTCEKEFSHKSNLLCHERTHSGERPYKCEVCGKMFKQGHHLSRHRKKMHE